MLSFQDVVMETRGNVELKKAHGLSDSQVRAEVVAELHDIVMQATIALFNELAVSPEKGFAFAYGINKTLGAVNEVLFKEYSIRPIHIKELNTVVVRTIEAFTNKDIDEVLAEIDEIKKRNTH